MYNLISSLCKHVNKGAISIGEKFDFESPAVNIEEICYVYVIDFFKSKNVMFIFIVNIEKRNK